MRIGVASFVQSFGTLIGTFGTSMLAVQNGFSIREHKFSYINASLIRKFLEHDDFFNFTPSMPLI